MNIPFAQRLATNRLSSRLPRQTNTRAWITLVVTVVCIVLAILASRVLSDPTSRLPPVLLLGAACGVVVLLAWYKFGKFEHGMLALALSGATLNFISIGTGTESRVVMSLVIFLVLMGVWLTNAFLNRLPLFRASPINVPIYLFIVINLISYGWFFVMRDPLLEDMLRAWPRFVLAQAAGLGMNILLPLLCLIVVSTIREEKWLRGLVGIMVFLAGMNAASKLLNLPIEPLLRNGSRGLFVMWGGTFVYAQLLFNRELGLTSKATLAVILAGILYYYGIRETLWLSGWFPLAVAIAVMTWFRSKKLFALLTVMALIYLALNFKEVYGNIVQSNVDEGGLGRLDIWKLNLGHVANHWLFGMGPAGYAPYNIYYHPTEARSTHNNYFDVLAQTGVVGSVVFIWLLLRLLNIGFVTRAALANQGNFKEMLANATLGGLVGTLVGMALGDWVLPFAFNQTIAGFDNALYTWLFLGCMVSLYLMVRRSRVSNPSVFPR